MNIVHLIDCNDFMADKPDNYYPLAIVDPPYGLGTVKFRTAKTSDIHKDKNWNNTIPPTRYFTELYRVSSNQIIWGCNYFGNNIIHPGRIVHHKELTPFIKNGRHASDCDLASQSFNRLIVFFHYRWCGNVQGKTINWNNTGPDRRIHPTQKPIALYKWLLQNYAKPGETIFDSHVGSGSIRIACHDLGFDFEGAEIDADYWQAQEDRYNNHIQQADLFEKDEIQDLIYNGRGNG